jgi:ABC-type phosphate transport system substrate-binding protein
MKPIKLVCACALLAANLAHAEIVVIVNPANPASRLFTEQAAQFFLGKSNLFTPVDQAKDSAIRRDFYQKIAGKSLAQMEGIWAKAEFSGKGGAPKAYPNEAAVKKAVASDPAAIGYIDKAAVDDTVKVVLTLQ